MALVTLLVLYSNIQSSIKNIEIKPGSVFQYSINNIQYKIKKPPHNQTGALT